MAQPTGDNATPSSSIEGCGHNVFLSFSGDESRKVAFALFEWLPRVNQFVKPWISEESIEKGRPWVEAIFSHIKECQIAIVCLTPDNLERPWLMFEAGAVALRYPPSSACPYLHNVKPTDVKPPMSLLQLTVANQTDTRRLVNRVNDAFGQPVGAELLKESFEFRWPALEKQLQAIKPTTPLTNKREPEELVAEILETVRSIDRRVNAPVRFGSTFIGTDSLMAANSLLNSAHGLSGVGASTVVGNVVPSSIPFIVTTADYEAATKPEAGLRVKVVNEAEDPKKKK
jgi:hypothetical protein